MTDEQAEKIKELYYTMKNNGNCFVYLF